MLAFSPQPRPLRRTCAVLPCAGCRDADLRPHAVVEFVRLAVVVLDVDRGAHAVGAAGQAGDVDPLEDEVPRVAIAPAHRDADPVRHGGLRAAPLLLVVARLARVRERQLPGGRVEEAEAGLCAAAGALRVGQRPGLVGDHALDVPVVVAVAGVLGHRVSVAAETAAVRCGTGPGRSPWSCRGATSGRRAARRRPGPSFTKMVVKRSSRRPLTFWMCQSCRRTICRFGRSVSAAAAAAVRSGGVSSAVAARARVSMRIGARRRMAGHLGSPDGPGRGLRRRPTRIAGHRAPCAVAARIGARARVSHHVRHSCRPRSQPRRSSSTSSAARSCGGRRTSLPPWRRSPSSAPPDCARWWWSRPSKG